MHLSRCTGHIAFVTFHVLNCICHMNFSNFIVMNQRNDYTFLLTYCVLRIVFWIKQNSFSTSKKFFTQKLLYLVNKWTKILRKYRNFKMSDYLITSLGRVWRWTCTRGCWWWFTSALCYYWGYFLLICRPNTDPNWKKYISQQCWNWCIVAISERVPPAPIAWYK